MQPNYVLKSNTHSLKSMRPIILIPCRLAATRLPGKPLADIAGKPMVIRMLELAKAANIGDVAVACDGEEIAHIVENAGGKAIITDPALPSGTDRVWAAFNMIENKEIYDIIINLQGDMPTLEPSLLAETLPPLTDPNVDIATLAVEITEKEEVTDPSVVKIALARGNAENNAHSRSAFATCRALYFSRTAIPHGNGPHYHHLGVYAFRRDAMERFVAMPQSMLEKQERLEQLRAMEAGMRIDVTIVNTIPLGVDTHETLNKARKYYETL